MIEMTESLKSLRSVKFVKSEDTSLSSIEGSLFSVASEISKSAYTLYFVSLTVVFILLKATPAQATAYEFYRGVRSVGMGGADTAVVNDETALLVNPAGLGKLQDSITTYFDPELELSKNFLPMYQAQAFSSVSDLENLKASLDSSRSTHYHYKFQIFPSYVIKNFGVGFLVKESMDASMNAAGTAITANYFYDWVLALGLNFRFWDGRIKLGGTAKIINRVQASGDFDPTQNLDIKTIGKEGQGVGFDSGLLLTLPWKTLPTLSIVARDIGDTKLLTKGLRYKLATRPDPLPQDADIALAFFPLHSNSTRSSFTIEHKHVLTAAQYTNKMDLYHLGWEINFSDAAFFRLGSNGKYYTTGFELSTETSQIQFAYYGEEVTVDGSLAEDRRIVFKYSHRL